MNQNKKNTIKILVIFGIIVSSYLISFLYITSEKLWYFYSLKIDSENGDEFIIQFPYPIISHKLNKNNNVLNIDIIDTTDGKFYEITGKDHVEIDFKVEKTFSMFREIPEKYYQMSAQDYIVTNNSNYERYNRLLINSSTNLTLDLDVWITIGRHTSGGSIRDYDYVGEVGYGWNYIKVEETRDGASDDFLSVPCCFFSNSILTLIMIFISYKIFHKKRSPLKKEG